MEIFQIHFSYFVAALGGALAPAAHYYPRRRLVIVSYHLPISARRDEVTNKWLIEWDSVRSDHMTPNLRMLQKDYDVSWVGWPGMLTLFLQ